MAYTDLAADVAEFNLLRGETQEVLEDAVHTWLRKIAAQAGHPQTGRFRTLADTDPTRPNTLRVHGFDLTAAHWEYSSKPSSLFSIYVVKVRYMVDRVPEYIDVETKHQEIRLFKFQEE